MKVLVWVQQANRTADRPRMRRSAIEPESSFKRRQIGVVKRRFRSRLNKLFQNISEVASAVVRSAGGD